MRGATIARILILLAIPLVHGQHEFLFKAKGGIPEITKERPSITLGQMDERLQRIGLSPQCRDDWNEFLEHRHDPLLLMGHNKSNFWAAKSI